MSDAPKLRGGTKSELTRFKEMWRDSFTELQRDYWRSRFVSLDTQAQIRTEIRTKLKIDLTRDDQLKAMRDWDLEQRALDLEAERQADEERRLKEAHPDWTKDQLREYLLSATYRRAMASGDFKLGMAAMKQDKAFMELFLDREKFEEMKRDAEKAREAKGIMQDKDLSEAQRSARMKQLFGISS